jgi:hypothetical protein
MNHFGSKKGCITNIVVHNKLKSWWHPLVILNTSKFFRIYMKTPKFTLSQNYLIQWLDKKDWIKSMYIEYIINFLKNNYRVSCFLVYKTLSTIFLKKNNAMPNYKISFLFHMVVVFS